MIPWLKVVLVVLVATVVGVGSAVATPIAGTHYDAATYVYGQTSTPAPHDSAITQHRGPPTGDVAAHEGASDARSAGGVAAKGGSALADASSEAFRAADGAAGWAPSAKHLAGAGGRWQKFAEGADPAALVQEALRSPGASFLPDKTAGRFIVETDLGRSIGTKGETWLKVVVSESPRHVRRLSSLRTRRLSRARGGQRSRPLRRARVGCRRSSRRGVDG